MLARCCRAARRRLHVGANPRALSPATLASLARSSARARRSCRAARRARAGAALAGPDGAVVVTGSIYLVADLVSAPGARRASAL